MLVEKGRAFAFLLALLLVFLHSCITASPEATSYLREVTTIEPDLTPQSSAQAFDDMYEKYLDMCKFNENCTYIKCNLNSNVNLWMRMVNFFSRFFTGKNYEGKLPEYSLNGAECGVGADFAGQVAEDHEQFSKDASTLAMHINTGGNPSSTTTMTLPKHSFLYFLVGAGREGYEFEQANRYCSNGMQLNTQWNVGIPYPDPMSGTARCYLEMNVIPLYILYSGKSADQLTYQEWQAQIQRTSEIAQKLDSFQSPIMLTTELDAGYSASGGYETAGYVAQQAHAILSKCTRCFAVITPEQNNHDILLNSQTGILSRLEALSGDQWENFKSRIIIGQGMLLNKFPDFTPFGVLVNITSSDSFARRVQHNQSMPVLYVYVAAKPEQRLITYELDTAFSEQEELALANAPKGQRIETMDQSMLGEIALTLFDAIPSLSRIGIIGFSFLKFYNHTDDYVCGGECIPMLDKNGVGNPLAYSYLYYCANYSVTNPNVNIYGTYGGNELCNFGAAYSGTRMIIVDNYQWPAKDEMQSALEKLYGNTPQLGCSNCFGIVPEPFVTEELMNSYTGYSSGDWCSKFDDIVTKWASYFPQGNLRSTDLPEKMDPVLISAIIAKESSFNPNQITDTTDKHKNQIQCIGLMQLCPYYEKPEPGYVPDVCEQLSAYQAYLAKGSSRTYDDTVALYQDPDFNVCYATSKISAFIWEMNNRLKESKSPWSSTISGHEADTEYIKWMSVFLGLSGYNGGDGGTSDRVNHWLSSGKTCAALSSAVSSGLIKPEFAQEFPYYMYYCLGGEKGQYALRTLSIYNKLLQNEDCSELCGALDFTKNSFYSGPLPIKSLPLAQNGIDVTSLYGPRYHPILKVWRTHTGIDLAPTGGARPDVLAVVDGKVIYKGWRGGYGNAIELQGESGLTYLYAHLDSFSVQLNQQVTAGQPIGRLGSTGLSTGPHLHFEIRENGVPQPIVNRLKDSYQNN